MHQMLSNPWAKALAEGKQDDEFDDVMVCPGPPDAANPNTRSGFNARGVVDIGQGWGVTPTLLLVQPYAEAEAGTIFNMRLYAWRPIGTNENDPAKSAWVYNLLAEFVCVVGEAPGPHVVDNLNTANAIGPYERLCTGLSLVRGVLGLHGFVNSSPDLAFPAYAGVTLYGARKVSFDFASPRTGTDDVATVAKMNCLYAR